ncbi:MAG: PD40 domain-containing protein [Candidatus Solibacter usitatus]|nr:PD40 domain-containing protein [Candidatus Solibacter usitatus]
MKTLVTFLCGAALLLADGPYLLQQPTMNDTHIVFVFAGDLWTVERKGGAATRLTTGKGVEYGPYFSPDGKTVVFTGEYDGNLDVFTVPASGGVPKRLTSHPAADRSMGWTPDGKRVLFISNREAYARSTQMYTVSVDGGLPEMLPFPGMAAGSLSPDGKEIAYMPVTRADRIWKRYQGGMTTPIWIGKLSDSSYTAIPRKNSNDHSPMWVGKDVYFLSDRGGRTTLFRYDTRAKQVAQAIDNKGLDIKSATAGPGGIVYEQFGAIHTYDFKSGKTQQVNIGLSGDLAEVRPRLEKAQKWIRNAHLSPSGARAVFEARGEIFTVPAEKGNARNITNSETSAERDPAWSPDGKWIAYFSDASGEYKLHLSPQDGIGEVKKISLGNPPSFFYEPTWSPDSKKISYSDKRLNLWYIDIEKQTPVKVDQSTYHGSETSWDTQWSPDSKWLAYSRQLKSRLSAISVYNLENSKATQITDGMSDARSPVWDRGGKYLYLTASTDVGPTTGGLDLSTFNRPVTRNVYVVVLRKEDPSPLAPESDEEKVAEEKKPEEKKDAKPAAVEVKIDLDGIEQRTIALPLPARNYAGMQGGKAGILFLVDTPSLPEFGRGPAGAGRDSAVIQKFDLSKRKADRFLEGVRSFVVSANGEKILYRQSGGWFIAATTAPPKAGDGRLKLDDIEMRIDPVAEWKQMYKEVLRIERDFFYDPNHHGLDLQALGERYEKYLKGIASRSDLNYLFAEMLGELSVGHLYIQGGDTPEVNQVRGGLLGADFKIENGRYRIAKVYNGENWNPDTRAPLTQPGVNVKEGDYILAINGKNLTGTDEIYALLEGTAGKNTRLRVGADAGGAGARDVTVTPIDSESGLRRLAWMEGNRRKVDQATGGKVAYVYLPDTAVGGYTYFNRYYFAQSDRQALIVDERFNGGGKAADYIIDYLRRPLWNYWSSRDGADYSTPATNIAGPKVMLINEYAGSGGDALPWYFRRAGLGKLIGKRTWGGLVGIGGYPTLIDGGSVTAPHFGFWNPDGKWDVENHGTDADIDVELDPKAWREGRDTQLEKAIEVILAELKKNPPPVHKKPPYPVYHPKPAAASGGAR